MDLWGTVLFDMAAAWCSSGHNRSYWSQGKRIEPKKNTNLFATEDSLIIRGVQEANNGAYQCQVTNQVGQGVSNTQTLNVKGKIITLYTIFHFNF